MALDITNGGSATNSYVSLADANTYFANHYLTAKNTAWSALTDPQKESILKRACQLIEELRVLDSELGFGSLPMVLVPRNNYELTIHRLNFNQALNFPRNIDVDDNNVGVIPQNVPDAQCEQAIYLLAFDESPLSTRLSGVSTESVAGGPVRFHQTFKEGGTALAPMAWELMRKFMRPTKRVQRA